MNEGQKSPPESLDKLYILSKRTRPYIRATGAYVSIMDSTKRYLFWLLEGTRGGPTRIRILSILAKRPMNLRQLALAAHLDYSTIEHHIHLLEKHAIVESVGEGYGHLYALAEEESAVRDYVREKIRGEGHENEDK